MPKIPSHGWRDHVRVLEAAGFIVEREKGDHIVLTKPGVARPAVVPKKNDLHMDIIHNNRRLAGLSHNQYYRLLTGPKSNKH